jgi:signal transduction histidine kinase
VSRNPRVLDVTFAVMLFVAFSVVGGLFDTHGENRGFTFWSYVLTGLITLPLAARRIAPMLVLVVISVSYMVFVASDHLPGLHLPAPMLAFYSVAAQRSPRVTAVASVWAVAAGFFSGIALHTPLVAVFAQTIAIVTTSWVLGNVARQLARRNVQLAEATEQLRREQEEHVARMLTQERLRIARELHDVVAHHMSVIATHAGLAGYVFESQPSTARASVDTIGATSREALDEMRRLLDLLRESEEPDADPVPRLGQLPALAERVRVAGVEIELRLDGDLEGLPSGLQLTVYRIVQEAVTNMVKHASPCRAEIVVRRDPEQLTATISNEIRAAPAKPSDGGYGLVGMRERARLYQGTLTAGHRPDGRYAVALTMPLH